MGPNRVRRMIPASQREDPWRPVLLGAVLLVFVEARIVLVGEA